MAVDTDYYALLEIEPTASSDQIADAYKKQMRTWSPRSSSASDPSVRRAAEIRVEQLAAALKTLKDDVRRRAYDAQLRANPPRPNASAPESRAGSEGTEDWVAQARRMLELNDVHSAAYAAREATRTLPDSAEAWYLLSIANERLGTLDEAMYEARKACTIDPQNPDYHVQVADVCVKLGNDQEAFSEYQRAATLAPDVPMYALGVVGLQLDRGNVKDALTRLESLHAQFPDDTATRWFLAQALLARAEEVPAKRDGDVYYISSAEEIAQMRQYADRIAGLRTDDPQINEWIGGTRAHLDDMEKKKFFFVAPMQRRAFAKGAEVGEMPGALIFGLAVTYFLMLPWLCFLGGLLNFGMEGGNPGIGVLLILGGAVLQYFFITWFYIVPKWKLNK